MATRIWEQREFPILRTVVEAHIKGRSFDDLDALSQASGIARSEIELAMPLLLADQVLQAVNVGGFGNPKWISIQPLPKAMRLVGSWPPSPPDAILDVLKELISREEDANKRTGLERLRDAFAAVGADVATSVLTALIQRSIAV